MRDAKRFRTLGAHLPAGILLHGPPGTGKTLLAKAVAHESGATFFSQSASSFVEMFAGLGSARIRRLFKEARKHAPAIIFIDELDAVGTARSGGAANREYDQTLNQLLVEMDGFDGKKDVVVIAASNLLEKLDPALLRPGRFDRHIFVSPPDVVGRERILEVHSRYKPVAETVDFGILARQTAGLTGADLANICNEAAINAARRGARHDRSERLRPGARARRRRHAVAPAPQRPRAARRRLPRGRPRAGRRAAAVRGRGAPDLDHPPRPRTGLHAQPARRGPLPAHPRRAAGLDDHAPGRARGRVAGVRLGHQRRHR